MKKIVFAIAVSLAFAACSNGNTAPTTKDSTKIDSVTVKTDSTKVDTAAKSIQN